ncbi:NTP transferase domain-containing protein [Phycicoccus endophyticus]|uniref:NTP transferase domain-containing protein n=1 Tax=Phycicoccus endophyticus TaxID=1690220 RepID=A0A7G9R0C2_9MICO|nr:NTP transferase domain-containing protein [Phycicoccus endophyticus]NHI20143.1 NTP transferase domain-containing protein [Phycicoccus endophyticus]QNN49047.1 NTP transferase domain-containing protein [Phycicoccus endophyticus]GGL38060.1 hypothetical protein GCM10012283_20800 [Phycicoccus endophyticus]
MDDAPAVTAVVLAGGRARRFGADKLGAPLRGTTVLAHLLDTLPPAWPLVGVGEPRPAGRAVTWTREEPPGTGPLAALLAGAALVRTPVAAVVAGDMPDAAPALVGLVEALAAAAADVGAAVGVDDDGIPNPLLAAYRTPALAARAALPSAGVPARSLLEIPHLEVVVPGPAAHDVDTPADLAAVEREA